MPEKSKSLAGQTLRWRFEEGPTAGAVFEHAFGADGTVTWREVGGSKKGDSGGAEAKEERQKGGAAEKPARPEAPRYSSFEVAPSTHVVSYLSDSGYTLTVALNLETQRCYGFASNEKEWYPLEGKLVPAQQDRNAA